MNNNGQVGGNIGCCGAKLKKELPAYLAISKTEAEILRDTLTHSKGAYGLLGVLA